MVKKYVSEGDALTFTAPGGGVVSGGTYVIGGLPVVADGDADASASFTGHIEGVFTLVKKSGTAWTAGDALYYDVSEANWTKTASDDSVPGGYAAADAASGDTTGDVRLTPTGTVGKASTIAALGTTTNLAASNVTLSTSDTYTDAAVKTAIDTAVDALKTNAETRLDNIETKVDAIIAALKVAKIVAAS